MPENTNNTTTDTTVDAEEKSVTAADVDWIDHYGSALIHGFRFTPGDIAQFEYPRDRDHTERLSAHAKARIATILTAELGKRVDLWQRAREAYRAERFTEGVVFVDSFQGPADTGISRRDAKNPRPSDTVAGEPGRLDTVRE